MRAAAPLHTPSDRIFRLGSLLARLRAVEYVDREEQLADAEDAPVRLLVCR